MIYLLYIQISQLLGHNEHLFIKFPRGFSTATRMQILAILFQGTVYAIVPSRAHAWGFSPRLEVISSETSVALRLAGAALLGELIPNLTLNKILLKFHVDFSAMLSKCYNILQIVD